MSENRFKDSDPWHINADFLFGFVCQYCDSQLHFDDVEECNPDEFEEACVIVSEKAQELGWVLIEEFSFSCPACSNSEAKK